MLHEMPTAVIRDAALPRFRRPSAPPRSMLLLLGHVTQSRRRAAKLERSTARDVLLHSERMDPIRVIGRIDLAQQIHAALVAEGADARLATAAPMAVIAETGRDGTGIDVLAMGFDVCPGIKKAAPQRPVVMVTWDEPRSELAAAMAASMARTARGPDAHLGWPATGRELLEACERAREASGVPRPRFRWPDLAVRFGPLLVGGLILWALLTGRQATPAGPCVEPSRSTAVVAQLVQTSIFAGSSWWSWRRAGSSDHPRWHRGWSIFAGLVAGMSLCGAVGALLR